MLDLRMKTIEPITISLEFFNFSPMNQWCLTLGRGKYKNRIIRCIPLWRLAGTYTTPLLISENDRIGVVMPIPCEKS